MTDDRVETGTDMTPDSPPGDRQDVLDVSAAAARLKVTPDAIRSRLRRGTLSGEKRDGEWIIYLPAEDPEAANTTADSTRQEARHSDTTPTVDLSPLVQLIDDLTRRNADLASAAALWQSRAAHLEDQLKQLTAGEAVEAPESAEPVHDGSIVGSEQKAGSGSVWYRLSRWIRGDG